MKRHFVKSVLGLCCVFVLCCAWAFAVEPLDENVLANALVLHVSPSGNDAWTGLSAEESLATLAGARDALRRMRASGALKGAVRVVLHDGVYRVSAPVVFSPEDSGSWDAPVVVEGEGPNAILSGGVPISGWKKEGAYWIADAGLDRFPSGGIGALWVNGEYRAPARMPNEGYFVTAGRLDAPATTDAAGQKTNPNAFRYAEGDIVPWEHPEDALVIALHSWDVTYMRVSGIDTEKREIAFTLHPNWAFEYFGAKQRYFVQGVREALDAPGEWYLDRRAGKLLYIAKPDEDPNALEIVAAVAEQLIRLEGDWKSGRFVEHLHFRGLRFEHTEFPFGPEGLNNAQAADPVPAAIQAEGARHCSITRCTVGRISHYGIWFQRGCQQNLIAHNEVYAMGAGGIRIGATASAADDNETTRDNWVDNNWIHDGGAIFPAAVGVWIGRSSYNTVSHNEIANLYYTGVSVGWSWGYDASSANHNTIEFNHIHHIGQRILSDMGGIYTLGVAPGTILRNNLIHDVFSYAYGGWGIYPDEGSSDLLIENNVVYNTKTGGFHQHYGRENRVRNNIFAFSHEGQVIRSREEEHISFFFERNIVVFNNRRPLGGNWNNDRFRMSRNCYWDISGSPFGFMDTTPGEWRAKGHDRDSIIADPMFRNPAEFDFALAPDSPAIAIGFRPIDIHGAGLYGEEDWVKGPTKLAYAPSVLPEPGKDLRMASNWNIAGPFNNKNGAGHDTVYPPEQSIDLGASYEGKNGETVRWTPYTVPKSIEAVDLRRFCKTSDYSVAYAVCYVKSDVERDAELRCGGNDMIKVWFDAKLVINEAPSLGGSVIVDGYKAPVHLRAGVSLVLVKVTNLERQWGFCLRFTDAAGQPVEGIQYAASP